MRPCRRLFLLLVGAAIGAIVGQRQTTDPALAPSEPSVWETLPDAPSADPSCPITPTIEALSLAEGRLAENIDQLTSLDAQLREVIGEPVPFSDAIGEEFLPDAVIETLGELDLEDVEIDCSEYPCLFFARVPEGDGCDKWDLFPKSWRYGHGSCGNGTVTRAITDRGVRPPDNRVKHRLRMFRQATAARSSP